MGTSKWLENRINKNHKKGTGGTEMPIDTLVLSVIGTVWFFWAVKGWITKWYEEE